MRNIWNPITLNLFYNLSVLYTTQIYTENVNGIKIFYHKTVKKYANWGQPTSTGCIKVKCTKLNGSKDQILFWIMVPSGTMS